MSKFYGYDENMQNDIAKITTPKLSLMSDVVAPVKEYLYVDDEGTLILEGGVLIAVGDSVFKTEETELGSANFDATVSALTVGNDYYVYICDPTNGDATDFSAEAYRISKNSTYPNGFTALNSRKIGGFHYGIVRAVDEEHVPISAGGTPMGSGWKTNTAAGIVPNSVWTLLNRPTCDPAGMVKVGDMWVDIYLSSDDGYNGLASKFGVNPITGTEGLNWYIANEKALRVGKRLPSYAEFCQYAYGSPQGEDNNNTYAWSKTTNTGRTTTGSVQHAVSAFNVRDAVGNVWEWLDELLHDPTAASANWYNPMSGQEVGQIYEYSETGLHALIGGGNWGNGVHDGSRSVICNYYPWFVYSSFGVRCVCDSL